MTASPSASDPPAGSGADSLPNRSLADHLVHAALAAVLLAFCLLLVVLFGLFGVLMAGALVAVAAYLYGVSRPTADATLAKVNCGACGARNDRERRTCHHCGEAL